MGFGIEGNGNVSRIGYTADVQRILRSEGGATKLFNYYNNSTPDLTSPEARLAARLNVSMNQAFDAMDNAFDGDVGGTYEVHCMP